MQPKTKLSAAAAFIVSCVASAGGAAAGETSYHSNKPWEVVLHVPEVSGGGLPYCSVRTTLWEDRQISVETSIGRGDALETAVRLTKRGWGLPVNGSTRFAASVYGLAAEVAIKATTDEELYTPLKIDKMDENTLFITVVLNSIRNLEQPRSLKITFEGNEPPWVVPEVGRFEAYVLTNAYNRCELDLRGLVSSAPVPGDPKTSPFGKAETETNPVSTNKGSDTGYMTIEQYLAAGKVLQSGAAQGIWKFSREQEDWGEECALSTTVGKVKVGFMATPGKQDVLGFVDGAYIDEIKAKWSVDRNLPIILDGKPDEYFGWHSFQNLPRGLLNEIASGNSLTISAAKNEDLVVDLRQSRGEFTPFLQCMAEQ